MTSDLIKRIWQHKQGEGSQFTKRYKLDLLVYFELSEDINSAIYREKQIKAGPRKKKLALIEASNPAWRDLYADLL